MLMHFAFKWKHRDGVMVEFEPDGWSPRGYIFYKMFSLQGLARVPLSQGKSVRTNSALRTAGA